MTMAVRERLCLAVVAFSLLVLCVGISLAKEDPELKVCKHQCKAQRQYDQKDVDKCLRDCDDYISRKKEREGREEGEDADEPSFTINDPAQKKPRQCQELCESLEGERRELCRFRCQEKYGKETGSMDVNEEEGAEEENPYVFKERHFKSRIGTEHGKIDVLQRFTKKSNLLRALEHCRLAILEADPQTFVAPVHLDAGFILFVAKGRGAITLIGEEKKQTFNLKSGDVFRVPAGTTFYMVNPDEHEQLYVVELIWPFDLPDKYKAFYQAGGEDGESFFTVFSQELLEAAFKTERGKLERIFTQKQQKFVKASKQQIQALSHGEEGGGGGIWPFPTGQSSSGPFNLFDDKRVVNSNNYGQLFEATEKDFDQLRGLDLAVSFANITRGSMSGPFYNSKSMKIAIVLEGEGYFEMACPHITSSGSSKPSTESRGSKKGKGGSSYQRISSNLSPGTVFVVPSGHPLITVASENSALKVLCFEAFAKGNKRYPLAGKWNVIEQMDREAKELAFGVPAREIEQAFKSQTEELFFPGPRRAERAGRGDA